MDQEYTLKERVMALFDSPKNIDFHIRSGDYFAMLATIMGFLEEALDTCVGEHGGNDRQRALAREVRHDLRYVQANYEIIPRKPEDIQLVRSKGNILR